MTDTTVKTRKPVPFSLDTSRRDQVTAVWEGLTMLDSTGAAYELPPWENKCVQFISQDFEDGRVLIEGSIDGIMWGFMHDRWGHETAVLTLADPMLDIAENPRFIRPRMTDGNEKTKASVKLFARRVS